MIRAANLLTITFPSQLKFREGKLLFDDFRDKLASFNRLNKLNRVNQ